MVGHHDLYGIIRENSPQLAPVETGVEPRLTPLPDIRAVLFDVYGTLFISASGDISIAAAANTAEAVVFALRSGGIDVADEEDAGREGHTILEAAIKAEHRQKKAAGIPFPEVDIREIWRQVLRGLETRGAVAPGTSGDAAVDLVAVAYECAVNPVSPMPHAGEAIRLVDERGLRLGIVSNAQFYTPLLFPALLNKPLHALGFDPDLCAWSYQAGLAKPSVELFTPILERLRKNGVIAAARDVLYVGNDCLNDVWTATGAGCRTALFAGDKRSLRMRSDDPRCREVQPDAVLTSLAQLSIVLETP